MENWFVLTCRPKQELRAYENLHRQGFHCYLPMVVVNKILRGKRTKCEEALFPGYAFVKFNPEGTNITTLRSSRGVRDFIRFGGKIAIVAEDLIENIRARCDAIANSGKVASTLKKNDKVRIEEGPFAGLEAIFSAAKGETRSLLLIEMLGKQQRLLVENRSFRIA